jgi:hypothetical protein
MNLLVIEKVHEAVSGMFSQQIMANRYGEVYRQACCK